MSVCVCERERARGGEGEKVSERERERERESVRRQVLRGEVGKNRGSEKTPRRTEVWVCGGGVVGAYEFDVVEI